jgi:hypothetical protein
MRVRDRHLREDEFLDLADSRVDASTNEHLNSCRECAAQYRELRQSLALLDSVQPPNRETGYGRQVWARVQHQVATEPPQRSFIPSLWARRAAAAFAAAAMVVIAFYVGRYSRRQPDIAKAPGGVTSTAQAQGQPVRERVLMMAVGDHLERSQMVLLELEHAPTAGSATVDISAERRRAEGLLEANRLYRQTALDQGDAGLANVLDELERVLIEVANSPNHADSADVRRLRERMQHEGIIFKVRVLDSRIQSNQPSALSARGAQEF